jgi:hypothetical protein
MRFHGRVLAFNLTGPVQFREILPNPIDTRQLLQQSELAIPKP